MADFIPTSGLGPGGEPVTSTSKQLTPSSHSDYSKKQMSPEARAQMREWLDAEDAREEAMKSGPPTTAKTPEEVEAEVKSQEGSRQVLERAEVAAQPDPFAPEPPPPSLSIPGVPLPPQIAQKMGEAVAKPVTASRPYTSQEFGETAAIKGPQTFEAAQDEAKAYEAQAKGRIAKEHAEQLAAIQAKRENDQQAALARINAASEEFAQRQAELFEKPSAWRTIMQAIAQALGAYGAGLTHGPNWAHEIIKNQQEQDLQLKKERAAGALEKMKAAGASLKQLEEYAKTSNERIAAQQKAQIDVIDARAAQMLAPFPQAQRQWAEKSATLKAESAAKVAKFVQESTESTASGGKSQEGTKQTVTETRLLPGQQPGGTVTAEEAKKAQYAAGILDNVETIQKNRQLNDAELRLLNRNVQSMRAQVEQATKGVSKPMWNAALQKAGILPETFTEGLSDEAKVVANAWLNATGLIIRDQSGAAITNPEDFTSGQKKMIQPGDGPKTRAEKLRILEMEGRNMRKLAGKQAAIRLADESIGEKPAPATKSSAGPDKSGPTKEVSAKDLASMHMPGAVLVEVRRIMRKPATSRTQEEKDSLAEALSKDWTKAKRKGSR